jgi:hypothetical protein
MDLRTFATLTTGEADQLIGTANFVPPGFLYQTASGLRDPFGNRLSVRTVNSRLLHSGGGGARQWQQLELIAEDVRTDICVQLVSQLVWGNNSRLATIEVNPATGAATSFQRASGTFLVVNASNTNTFPVSPSNASVACDSTNVTTIRWRFVKAPV